MKSFKFGIFLVCLVGSSSLAIAGVVSPPTQLEFGEPVYTGNGCPQGSVSVAISPDKTALTVIYSELFVEAGIPTTLIRDRKSCTVVMPLTVPAGYSVGIFKSDFRGSFSVPKSGFVRFLGYQGILHSTGFFDKKSIPRVFYGRTDRETGDLDVTSETQSAIWSTCGGTVEFVLRNDLEVRTNASMEQATSTLDTADVAVTPGATYHFQYQTCNAP